MKLKPGEWRELCQQHLLQRQPPPLPPGGRHGESDAHHDGDGQGLGDGDRDEDPVPFMEVKYYQASNYITKPCTALRSIIKLD